MKYKEMIEEAKQKGLTSEKIMWESLEEVEDLLCLIKESHKKEYWKFLRKTHGKLYKGHYNEAFAMYDVNEFKWTDKHGNKHEGAYWTCQQIMEATKDLVFPPDVTKWDKYVAFNVFKADLAKELEDTEIIKAAYLFWFEDEDWEGNDKVWRYFCMKNK